MAKSILKTISTSLTSQFLEELRQTSGIPLDVHYSTISTLLNYLLLDSKSRIILLKEYPQLRNPETRKKNFSNIDMKKLRKRLLELILETANNLKDEQMRYVPYLSAETTLKLQIDININLQTQVNNLKKLLSLSDKEKTRYVSQLEKIKENNLKIISKHTEQISTYKEEIKSKNAYIRELENKLTKKEPYANKDIPKNISLNNHQKIKNRAAVVKPIVKRILYYLNNQKYMGVYLLKQKDYCLYYSRITNFQYNEKGEFYINSKGEKEYLSYIITTQIYINGKWKLHKTNEIVTDKHLVEKSVDHNCIPITIKGFKAILKTLYLTENKKSLLEQIKPLKSLIPIIQESPYSEANLFSGDTSQKFYELKNTDDIYHVAYYFLHLHKLNHYELQNSTKEIIKTIIKNKKLKE